MTNTLFTLMFLSIAFASVAQKPVYDANAEKISVSNYNSIHASAGVTVYISPSSKQEVALSVTPANLRPYVKVEVKDGVLIISRKTDWKLWEQFKNVKIRAYVSYTTLIELEASSGAMIKGEIKTDDVAIHANSGGIMELEGAANKLNAHAGSGGMIKGYNLKSNDVNSKASSGGGIYIAANRSINAQASSGGFIKYRGDAKTQNISTSSGGSVKRDQ